MDSHSNEQVTDLDVGRVLGMVLAFDFLMKNDYIEAASVIANRIMMSDDIDVDWDDEERMTIMIDKQGAEYKLTDKAFM